MPTRDSGQDWIRDIKYGSLGVGTFEFLPNIFEPLCRAHLLRWTGAGGGDMADSDDDDWETADVDEGQFTKVDTAAIAAAEAGPCIRSITTGIDRDHLELPLPRPRPAPPTLPTIMSAHLGAHDHTSWQVLEPKVVPFQLDLRASSRGSSWDNWIT